LTEPEGAAPFVFITDPNGTLIGGGDPSDCEYDEWECIKEEIDDDAGGAQPEDPLPEQYGVLDRFQWKLLVLAVGMIMVLGSPIAGVHFGADPATWIKILFVMFFGIGILWQLKFM
jgi:hypothetical protein